MVFINLYHVVVVYTHDNFFYGGITISISFNNRCPESSKFPISLWPLSFKITIRGIVSLRRFTSVSFIFLASNKIKDFIGLYVHHDLHILGVEGSIVEWGPKNRIFIRVHSKLIKFVKDSYTVHGVYWYINGFVLILDIIRVIGCNKVGHDFSFGILYLLFIYLLF